MGKVLEFVLPENRKKAETFSDPHEVLKQHTLEVLRELTAYYRSTGKWDHTTCDPHIISALNHLQSVCIILAEKIGVSDEQPPSVG